MKRIFKSVLVLLTLCYSLVSYAGFYGGVGLGVRSLSADLTNFYIADVELQNLDLAVTAPAVDFTVGYQNTLSNHFFYAFEAFYEYVNMGTTIGTQVQVLGNTVNESLSAELDYNFGISTLLGYKTQNNDIFYTRLGFLIDDFRFKATSSVAGESDTYNYKHYDAAIQAGVGFQHPLTKRLSLRADYAFSFYITETASLDLDLPVLGPQTVLTVKPFLISNAGTLSLIYSF